jgi:hypothetical protein
MNQSETDLGIVNESQLLGFGISEAYPSVVPAKAGTHSHKCVLLNPRGSSFVQHWHWWLWVPARAEPVIGRRFAPTGRDDRKINPPRS